MRTDVSRINEQTPYEELTEGLMMFAGATSKEFHTGEWRTMTPIHLTDKCRQCLLCVPVCPDSFPWRQENASDLTMTTARDAVSVRRYVRSVRLR